MAKGQKKSNKEIRKPKADKGKKHNASNPSTKEGVVRGLDNFKSLRGAADPSQSAMGRESR